MPAGRIGNFVVHQSSARPPGIIKMVSLARVPFELGEAVEIFIIDKRNLPACEFYFFHFYTR